jgi:hypothetical protein
MSELQRSQKDKTFEDLSSQFSNKKLKASIH